MSCLSLMIMMAVALYFIVDLFQRKPITVIFNPDLNTLPVINISTNPLLITLGDFNGQPLAEDLYSFDVKILNYRNFPLPDGNFKFGFGNRSNSVGEV